MRASPETRKKVLSLLKERRATCGACGCDDVVDRHMRTDRDMQWKPRPGEDTDVYYCGCQNDHEQPWWF